MINFLWFLAICAAIAQKGIPSDNTMRFVIFIFGLEAGHWLFKIIWRWKNE